MDPITQYFHLAARRPELFAPSDQIPLCMDEETLRHYSASTGRPVGVVYDNLPYYLVLADLCVRESGEFYTYARVVYPHKSNGVVVIPCRNDRFGLLSIFRHPPRAENGAKELWEELGVRIAPEELEFLGEIQTDTGISAGKVQVFCTQVGEVDIPADNGEGIHGLRWVTPEEMARQVADGTITDGITLGAYLQYLCRKKMAGNLSSDRT